ncbi:hypothetical protein YC2023_114055 [Brassica napus]
MRVDANRSGNVNAAASSERGDQIRNGSLHQAKRRSSNGKREQDGSYDTSRKRRGTTSIHRECRIVSPAMMQRPPSAESTSSLSGSWSRHSHPLLSG